MKAEMKNAREAAQQTQEVKQVTWFDDRFYKITLMDGSAEYIPSVTTKLNVVSKPFLARWRGDIGNREADIRVSEAQEKGNRIHNAFSVYLLGGAVHYVSAFDGGITSSQLPLEFSEAKLSILREQEEMFAVWKLDRWMKATKPAILASELIVFSLATKDAGTVDAVLEIPAGEYEVNGSKKLTIPKGRYIVDLKTGNAVDDDAFLQTAAYAKCYEAMGLGVIEGTIILHTGSKVRSGIEGLATLLRTTDDLKTDYDDYRKISSIWERKNARIKPEIFEFPSIIKMETNS